MLLQLALGDHQVANITAEVEARTIGASVYRPALEAGRHWEADPFMDIPEVVADRAPPTRATHDGLLRRRPSDVINPANNRQGTATPPNENVPPRQEWGYGDDPHGYPRASRGRPRAAEEWLLEETGRPLRRPGRLLLRNGWTGAP